MPKIALIGAGLMGAGLSSVFQTAGWTVSAFDLDREALSRLAGARPAYSIADAVHDCDLVIEAVAERLEVKQSVFDDLMEHAPPQALLATNSSVIPVGRIAERAPDGHAQRILGAHFWNPPDLIPLVEVIPGPRTADWAMDKAMDYLRAAGKEPVRVRQDVVPGNRLQHALWREALALVEEGVCAPADVDHIIKRSFGMRLAVLGPLENADLVGLRLTQQIHEVVLPTLSRATAPSALLEECLKAGHGGVKDGAGLYPKWTSEDVAALRRRLSDHLNSALRPASAPHSGGL